MNNLISRTISPLQDSMICRICRDRILDEDVENSIYQFKDFITFRSEGSVKTMTFREAIQLITGHRLKVTDETSCSSICHKCFENMELCVSLQSKIMKTFNFVLCTTNNTNRRVNGDVINDSKALVNSPESDEELRCNELAKNEFQDVNEEIDVCSGGDDSILELEIPPKVYEVIDIRSSSDSDIDVTSYEVSQQKPRNFVELQ